MLVCLGSAVSATIATNEPASVERMVRDMEAKVNKLLDLQGSWRNDRGYPTQSGMTNQKKKSGEIDADELMNNITSYIKKLKDKSRFIRSCAKIADLQAKVSDLLEKNQEYVSTIIDLREKRNETLRKLSEVSEGHLNNREELEAMKEKLNIAETAARDSSQQKEQFEALKKEHESLIGIHSNLQRSLEEQIASKEAQVNELKAQLASVEKKTDGSASSTKGGQEAETGEENQLSVLDAKIVKLEKELLKEREINEKLQMEMKSKIDAIKSEASSKMKEVVQKKTQKVMGNVYKQISNEFKDSHSVDGGVILGKVKDIIKDTTMKLFS